MEKQPNNENQETPVKEVTPVQTQPTEVLKKELSKAPIEKPISTKTTPISFSFTNENLANEQEMAPVRDILATGEQESMELGYEEPSFLTTDEVAHFLEASYQIQGVFTYPDLWKRPKEFFYEIAEGILPNLNNWAMRFPAVGHAVKTVSAAGSWGKLVWDLALTYIQVNSRKQAEAKKKKEEEEENLNDNRTQRPGILIP